MKSAPSAKVTGENEEKFQAHAKPCAHLRSHCILCLLCWHTTQLITNRAPQLHNHLLPVCSYDPEIPFLHKQHEGGALFAQIAARLMVCFCLVTASPSFHCLSSQFYWLLFIGCSRRQRSRLTTVSRHCVQESIWGVLLQTQNIKDYELLFCSVLQT